MVLYISAFLTLLYSVFILKVRYGWSSFEHPKNDKSDIQPFVSVIVAFKNEKENLPKLLDSLKNQDYPKNLYEVIAVNDNSDDEDYSKYNSSNIQILNSYSQGKKSAIKQGIEFAKGEIILTTDADCHLSKSWIFSMIKVLENRKVRMILGSVSLSSNRNTFFQNFQKLDFLALQLVGAGAAIMGYPIYCNAANMGFKKDDWQQAVKIQKGENFISGDDVFLLHSFKKLNKKIVYNKSSDAIVSTNAQENIKQFLNQRIRWGSKTVGYDDKHSLFVAFLVFGTNFFLALIFLVELFSLTFPKHFVILVIIKSFSDYILLKSGSSFFDIKINVLEFLIFSFIYPIYIIYSAIMGLFKANKW